MPEFKISPTADFMHCYKINWKEYIEIMNSDRALKFF
jgi:hypothetical protein